MPQNCPPVSVGFGLAPILDDRKTAAEGREIYRDVEFIKIAIPGDRASLLFQPATDQHKKRFPNAWKEFQARASGTQVKEGLPVTHWAPISKATALNLMAINVNTVEELAVVHDNLVDRIPGEGRRLRDLAKAFVEQAKDNAAIVKATNEKREMHDQIKALQAQIAALQAGNVNRGPQTVPNTSSPKIKEAAEETDILEDVTKAARRARGN